MSSIQSTTDYTYYTHSNTYPITIQPNSVQNFEADKIQTAPQYLFQYNHNIYTTIKLLYYNNKYCYTNLLYHICRLCNVQYDTDILTNSQYAQYIHQQLQQILIQLHKAVSQIQQTTLPNHLMCVILLNTDNSDCTVLHAYIKPIIYSDEPVTTALAGQPRFNSYVKHTQWITDRQQLDTLKQQLNVHEIILQSSNCLYEGLIHNVFVVKHDATSKLGYMLQTIDKGVLHGVARHNIITVCQQLNISIEYTAANISEIDQWCCIILCNALHNVVVVDRVLYWSTNSRIHTSDNAIQHQFALTEPMTQFVTILKHGVEQLELESVQQNT